MTSYIICAFVSGFLLATVIFWIVTKQLQAGWHAEYRRLMGGIEAALICITKPTETGYRLRVIKILQNTYNGDKI